MKVLSMLGVAALFSVFILSKGYVYSDFRLWILVFIITISLLKAWQLAIKKNK